jgi:hypothetical protein
MALGGGAEIGIEPDRAEDVQRVEGGRDRRVAAVAAWIAAIERPTALAKDGSIRPAWSSLFQTGWVAGGRYSMAKRPEAASCPRIAGALPGTAEAAVRSQATS